MIMIRICMCNPRFVVMRANSGSRGALGPYQSGTCERGPLDLDVGPARRAIPCLEGQVQDLR